MAEHHLSELQRWARAAAISSDTRDSHGSLTLPPLPPRILCASAGHYPHPPRSLCSTPLPGSRDPGTTSPGEHTVHLRLLQCHVGPCCCRLAPHSNYDYCTPPSPQPEWARDPYSATALTPTCWGREQMPEGDLHAEAGLKPKLNPRSCENKEEKGKFLSAASGAAD